jgi:DNA-binding GntR family transcriptional regulator
MDHIGVPGRSGGDDGDQVDVSLMSNSAEYCRQEILRRIRAGALRPGEQVRQEAISAQLGVSRGPIRQALAYLASDGVLEHVPNSGFFVKKFTAAELSEVYAMRQRLETMLYESLDTRSLDIARLQACEEKFEAAMNQFNIHRVISLNRQLHWVVFDHSPLGIVKDYVWRLWLMSDAHQFLSYVDEPRRQLVVAEHRALLVALADGDLAGAIAIADAHREETRQRITAFMDLLTFPPVGSVPVST